MSKINTPKYITKCAQNICTKSHVQCVNNHNAKFESKGMKTAGVTDYTNQTPSKHFELKKCLSSRRPELIKIFLKCAQNIECTKSHLQCVNNHYAKFEYKGMKTVGVTDYTN